LTGGQEVDVVLPVFELPRGGDRVFILMNPTAGAGPRGWLTEQLAECLRQSGLRPEITYEPAGLADLAAASLKDGSLRAVVAAGGDGTVELIANCTPPGVPIAVLPLGTENLLAKYLHLKTDPRQVAAAIIDGSAVQLDAGVVGNRLFLLMLSCGFDAEVVRRLHDARGGHIQHLSYARPIVESIRSYEYPALRVRYSPTHAAASDATAEVELVAYWVFVFNIPSYALGLEIIPDAVPHDGALDVCTFQGGSFWHGLYHFSAVVLGQHRLLDDCRIERVSRLRIESDKPVPYQLDGEPGGQLPVEVGVLPGRLTCVVPHEWRDSR